MNPLRFKEKAKFPKTPPQSYPQIPWTPLLLIPCLEGCRANKNRPPPCRKQEIQITPK
jgi:hypothetical protein